MTDFVIFIMFIIVMIGFFMVELIDYLDRKEAERLREEPMVQHLMWRDYKKEMEKIRRETKDD